MEKLVGRFKLVSHGVFSALGVYQGTSDFLKGELIYSSEGFLSVQIFFREEMLSGKDILAYSGKYKIRSENEIEHHIEICSQAKRDRTIEKRNYVFNEAILTLSISYPDKSRFEANWKLLDNAE